jgi:N-carbamoyl-L-amino-acid hydrolase
MGMNETVDPGTSASDGAPAEVQPDRVVADLRELAQLTGGPDGGRRVCWTPEWQTARSWLRSKLAGLPCAIEVDEAGNLWATITGDRPGAVVVGSHIDCVPHGGWLDGALGIVAAVEMLRMYAHARPPVSLRLVDWADEEGARFGRSLIGSSAVAGTLDVETVRGLRDRDGVLQPDAMASCGVSLDHALEAGSRLSDVKAYLELHIEQGPVLESLGIPLGAVLGTVGVERHAVQFTGRANHAGSTPMNLRHDALLAAARFALEARESARARGGVATCGKIAVEPGIVTAIPGTCTITLDQRQLNADVLAAMLADARAASERVAAEEGVSVTWERIWQIEPILFDPTLVQLADESCREAANAVHRLPSGPLHDAAEMARRVPTAMLFVTSTNGVSHSPAEDTPIEHLLLAVRAHAGLTRRTLAWVASRARIGAAKTVQ